MILRLSIIILLTSLATRISAQSDQYVIKFNGDTIYGKIQINPMRDNTRSMYFKNLDGTKENLRPVRISYVYFDEEYQFRSVPFYNQRLFMQILKEDDRISYYNHIHKRENSVATTKVALKPDGEALELSALTFRRQILDFLDDCPSIVAKVENKEYKFKDYEQLFADYNDCDEQLVVVSKSESNAAQNSGSVDQGNSANITGVAASTAVAAESSNLTTQSVPPSAAGSTSDTANSKNVKLQKIDAFRGYVRSLTNYEHSRDVLEWLTEIEFRIIEDRDIPNFLWSSLEEMSEDHEGMAEKSKELKNNLTD
jgi:hypothetical protein